MVTFFYRIMVNPWVFDPPSEFQRCVWRYFLKIQNFMKSYLDITNNLLKSEQNHEKSMSSIWDTFKVPKIVLKMMKIWISKKNRKFKPRASFWHRFRWNSSTSAILTALWNFHPKPWIFENFAPETKVVLGVSDISV